MLESTYVDSSWLICAFTANPEILNHAKKIKAQKKHKNRFVFVNPTLPAQFQHPKNIKKNIEHLRNLGFRASPGRTHPTCQIPRPFFNLRRRFRRAQASCQKTDFYSAPSRVTAPVFEQFVRLEGTAGSTLRTDQANASLSTSIQMARRDVRSI